MRRYALVVIVVFVGGATGLMGWRVVRDLVPSYDWITYRTLDADVYDPTFFTRFSNARKSCRSRSHL